MPRRGYNNYGQVSRYNNRQFSNYNNNNNCWKYQNKYYNPRTGKATYTVGYIATRTKYHNDHYEVINYGKSVSYRHYRTSKKYWY